MSTVPSGSLRTQPVTAHPSAHSEAVARNPTFCTRPENLMQSRMMSLDRVSMADYSLTIVVHGR